MIETISYVVICLINVFYAYWNSNLLSQRGQDTHDLGIAFKIIAINNYVIREILMNEKDLSEETKHQIQEALSINSSLVKLTYMYNKGLKR